MLLLPPNLGIRAFKSNYSDEVVLAVQATTDLSVTPLAMRMLTDSPIHYQQVDSGLSVISVHTPSSRGAMQLHIGDWIV